MTWLYIVLAVVVVLWAVWVTCKAMRVMGSDVPSPLPPETVLCFRCGDVIPEAELGSHYCGHDDTQ